MKNNLGRLFQVGILLVGTALGCLTQAMTLETVENLNKAQLVEAIAHNKYIKFAEQADKDGFPTVSKLFRSIAFSELMHSRNHAAAMEGLGGKLQKLILSPNKVGSTKENLESAAKDERRNEIAMYEAFIAQSEKDGLRDAKTSFQFALDSEIQHKQLFEKGFTFLGPKNVDYYVDVKSGEITEVHLGDIPPKSKLVGGTYVKAAY